jgi:hypothetical protein
MVTIYCIEDCNSLKYIGSTKNKITNRLTDHKRDKRNKVYVTSSQLDLDNSKIYSLETCNESNRKARESYWINKIECVNQVKLNYDHNKARKIYYRNNKERCKEYDLFRRKHVVNGCYEFITMINEY